MLRNGRGPLFPRTYVSCLGAPHKDSRRLQPGRLKREPIACVASGISRASAFVLVAKRWRRVARPWEDWWRVQASPLANFLAGFAREVMAALPPFARSRIPPATQAREPSVLTIRLLWLPKLDTSVSLTSFYRLQLFSSSGNGKWPFARQRIVSIGIIRRQSLSSEVSPQYSPQ